jgi:hypothetical protein
VHLITNLGIPKIEWRAYACAGIKAGHQVPFDLLFYLCVIGGIIGIFSAELNFLTVEDIGVGVESRQSPARLRLWL